MGIKIYLSTKKHLTVGGYIDIVSPVGFNTAGFFVGEIYENSDTLLYDSRA
jgi:hypothetical protein